MNVLDLFSGIGGFSLGLESTGFFKTIAFVEKDKFCQKVLQKNFPNIPIEDDVRNVRGEKYKAEIITGGFPCQPFSVAGKRRGTDDDRFLWDETIRIVSETKCKWFIGENVEGIINIQDGMVLRQVQNDLEKEGFEVQCLIIPASGIGAWHQRKRVWILAYSNDNGSHRSKGNETKQSSNKQENRLSVGDDKNVPNTNTRFSDRENNEIQTGRNAFNSFYKQGKKEWWKIEQQICRTPNGLSSELDKYRKDRIKALGNSIVPQIARELGLAIMKAELDETS